MASLRNAVFAAALVGGVLVAGCTAILGDFTITASGDGGGDGGREASSDTSVADNAQPDVAMQDAPSGDATDAGLDCGTLTNCSGTCTNTTNNATHCGSACAACASEESCVNSNCMCVAPNIVCSGTCLNPTTDPHNCGSCGHDCQGGACTTSVCQPVLLVPQAMTSNVTDISSDGHVVVWSDNGDNTIDEVATPGGAKVVLASSPVASNPYYVGVSPTGNNFVGWVQSTTTPTVQTNYATLGQPGSGTLNVTFAGGANGLAVDPAGAAFYTLRTLAPDISVLSCGYTGACNNLTSVSSTQGSFTVAYGGGWVIWSDVANAVVEEYHTTNGVSVSIPSQPTAFFVAADGTNAYWISGSSQANIFALPLGVAGIASTVATNATGGVFAADGTNVYFNTNMGALAAQPLSGGAQISLAVGVTPDYVKVIGGAVYYLATTGSSPGIYRIATP